MSGQARHGLFVFHRGGRPIKDFRAAWAAAREYRRLGVSEGEIMKLCGWKTRSMFDRYNIIDAADLSAAAAKRVNGQGPVKSEAPAASPASLSSSAS